MARRNWDRLGRGCKGSAACSGEYEANFLVWNDLSRGDTLTRETPELKNSTKEIRQWCEVVIAWVRGTSDAER